MNHKNSSKDTLHCPLWTALVTPFCENGELDLAALRHIAEAQADAGNGILLLGSTGEGLALTPEEKILIVEAICALRLKVPLMVAVGGHNLAEQLAWIQYCNDMPIDAFLLGTPLYAKPGVVGQTHWFQSLLDAARYPCMLYNVPSRSGVEIPVATLRALAPHPNCWAMKEASGDIAKFLAYRQVAPDLALFSGEDGLTPYLIGAGACGLVSVCSNAWPQATRRYVELALDGEERQLFPLWQRAIASLFAVANPIPVKSLMHQQQQIATPVLRPPLTHLELEHLEPLLTADRDIKAWLCEQRQTLPSTEARAAIALGV